MSLKIPLQLYDASPKNIVDLTDLENHGVQSKGRITYLSHSCFLIFLIIYFCTEKSLYAYSLKDVCSVVGETEVKLSDFQPDSHWEKHIDDATHRLELLSLLRWGVMSWRLVEWRVLVFLTGWSGGTLLSAGYLTFLTRNTFKAQEKGWC